MKRIISLILTVMLMIPVFTLSASVTAHAEGTKLVAITFDDGSSKYTESLLDGLEEKGAVATFFMCGANGSYGVKNYSKYLSRMIADGDQIADHTWSHDATADTLSDGIEKVGKYLTDAMGNDFNYLVRIPGGEDSDEIREAAGHPIIMWSLDTEDWDNRNADTVYDNIVNNVKDGDIILLHDIYSTSVEGALRAIDELQREGYEFVTVSELFRRRGITLKNGKVYKSAPNKGTDLPAYEAPYAEQQDGYLTVYKDYDDMTFYYTTDGSDPTMGSKEYKGSTNFGEDVTVKVAGFDSYGTRTPITTINVQGKPAYPVIGKVKSGKVSLKCTTSGAQIFYTTDGSDPCVSGTLYSGAFEPGTVTRMVAKNSKGITSGETTFYKTQQGDIFYDVRNTKWYYKAVGKAVDNGWMSGTGKYKFSPNVKLTRAMLVTILYKLQGKPEVSGKKVFSDVKTGKWYSNAIEWASENDIVSGYSNKKFKPNTTVTRQQAAAILYSYAQYCGADTIYKSDITGYEDSGKVSDYAFDAMEWCVHENIMSGISDTTLGPKELCSRAQCAVMLSAINKVFKEQGISTKKSK